MASRASGRLNKRNLQLAVVAVWLVLTVWIAIVPYEPMTWDLPDATTNYIWTREYARGVYYLPLDEWNASGYPPTQSSVVLYHGELVVVNEKGPGHALLIVPFYLIGAEALFGPLMAGLAVLSTYVLGYRLFSWRVGLVAAASVLVNLSVLTMWHRFYWTDASTMPFLVASGALLVEALHRANGGSLDPRAGSPPPRRDALVALALSFLGGLAFGISVSTRYPTALVLLAFLLYLTAFGFVRAWPRLRRRDIRDAVRSLRPLALVLPFALGLLVVLVPLIQYNTTYFGGPFRSGYDATSLMDFNATQGLDTRNQTEAWFSSPAGGMATALQNAVVLAPILLFRMPLLLFLPLALWFLRRNLALALFLPWILLAFYTYLSLGWVVRFARLDIAWQVPMEPRYFMPALPAVAILGGWVIERVACGGGLFHRPARFPTAWKSVAVAGLLLLPAVFCGIAPAAVYLQNPSAASPGGRPGPDSGGPLTLHMLLAAAQASGEKLAGLAHAVDVQGMLSAGFGVPFLKVTWMTADSLRVVG